MTVVLIMMGLLSVSFSISVLDFFDPITTNFDLDVLAAAAWTLTVRLRLLLPSSSPPWSISSSRCRPEKSSYEVLIHLY